MSRSSARSRTAAVFVTTILAGSPLLAGVVFEVETTYHSGSTAGRSTSSEMSVEGKNLKMEILAGEGGGDSAEKDEAIFRGDLGQMVIVDHRTRSYMEIDGEALKGVGGQMAEAMKAVEKQLEGLDPKQREMMERMLKERMGGAGAAGQDTRPPVEFRNTGERGDKQGYPCVRWDMFVGQTKMQELWVTDWSNIRGGVEVAGAFREMAAFYSELLDSFREMAGGMGFFNADRGPMEAFQKVDGFPVVTRSFEGGELESETVLESVTERDLDPDAFEPPQGYRLRTMGPQ